MIDTEDAIARLRDFQRQVRDALIRSRSQAGLHEVSRGSAADTIYQLDTVVEPMLDAFCHEWAKTTPLVLIAEGVEGGPVEGVKVFPEGAREEDAAIRVIVDPIDGTRGLMYDKRSAWALAGVAPNRGPSTRLRDIECAVMTELPTSKMEKSDVLWAVKGDAAAGVREYARTLDDALAHAAKALPRAMACVARVFPLDFERALRRLTLAMSDKSSADVVQDLQTHCGFHVDVVSRTAGEIDALIDRYYGDGYVPSMEPFCQVARPPYSPGEQRLSLSPSRARTIAHGFASVSNFFPGTKVLSSELMEHLVRHLVGEADVTKALIFDDQYISTGGQFYELIVGHDRFNADLRPLLYKIQKQPPGLCCHPYDCATWLIAEAAGVILTDGTGAPLDGPLDVTTGLSWAGYANPALRATIEPLMAAFLRERGGTSGTSGTP